MLGPEKDVDQGSRCVRFVRVCFWGLHDMRALWIIGYRSSLIDRATCSRPGDISCVECSVSSPPPARGPAEHNTTVRVHCSSLSTPTPTPPPPSPVTMAGRNEGDYDDSRIPQSDGSVPAGRDPTTTTKDDPLSETAPLPLPLSRVPFPPRWH